MKFNFETSLKRNFAVFAFLGLIAFCVGLFNDPQRTWMSYLLSWFFFVSLSLASLLFVSLHYVGNSSWFVNVRRIFESFSSFLKHSFFLGLIFLVFGASQIYSWLDPAEVAKDYLLQHKEPYLNQVFLWIRYVVFFAIWLGFAFLMTKLSLKQDKGDSESLRAKLVKYSVIFILLFALSYSLFSIDFLMSLEPHWFSTIFGVYCFAGAIQTCLCFAILTIIYLQKNSSLKDYVSKDHLHDLGKYLMGFTVFWAYIAFSQYMLIWYANLPEETLFFFFFSQSPWVYVSLALIVFKFIVPFVYLLPRWVKRSATQLSFICYLIIGMQFLDLFWLIYPNLDPHRIYFGFSEVFIFLGFLSLFLYSCFKFLSENPIVALKDPRSEESTKHHVVY